MKQLVLDSASEIAVRSAYNEGVVDKKKRTAASVYRDLCTDARNRRMRVAVTVTRIQKMWSSWAATDAKRAKKAKRQEENDTGVAGAGEAKGGEDDMEVDKESVWSEGEEEEEEEPMICVRCMETESPSRMLVVKWIYCHECNSANHLECTGRRRMPSAKWPWRCTECTGAGTGAHADGFERKCMRPRTDEAHMESRNFQKSIQAEQGMAVRRAANGWLGG